ncbi:MAG: phosphatase, partial [Christensenellaceae bacterium]
IHASGGIASVAHPGRITLSFGEREKIILRLAEYGVDGIEAFYTTHTEEETEYFEKLAQKAGLLVTGGSDTHVETETHKIGRPLFYPSEKLLAALGV